MERIRFTEMSIDQVKEAAQDAVAYMVEKNNLVGGTTIGIQDLYRTVKNALTTELFMARARERGDLPPLE